MARTTYQAPGVYVEEVPSAQQPIAGVGTNTVGFIGFVPDKIEYPVPLTDEELNKAIQAQLDALRGAGKNQEEIQKQLRELERQIQELEGQKAKIDDQIKAIEEKKLPPELPEEEAKRQQAEDTKKKRDLEGELRKLERRNDQLKGELDVKRGLAASEKKSSTGDEKRILEKVKELIRPYKLAEFTVEVKPGDSKLCTNFSEYTSRFGPFSADDPDVPEQALYPGHRALTHAVYGFFKNGGTRCFVVRVKANSPEEVNLGELQRALRDFESIDAIAIVAAPGLYGKEYWNALVEHCETCQDRFAIMDCHPHVNAEEDPKGELDIRLLNYDKPSDFIPDRNKNAAFYFPYIRVMDPAKQVQDLDPARAREVPTKHRGKVYVAPSGHIAGIYARTDEERGVHKAPANRAVLGALDVKYYIGKQKQELLNPQGVNCIRNLNGNIVVWGARTLGGDLNGEWKYVNVRRLFLFLAESIDEGTQWCVFEPNDPTLWGKIRRNVSAFLTNVWRSGALFGLTPEEAFYVKCDEETNPPEVRDLGQVVTEIGVAIVRPAEFVIFRITQATGPRPS